MTINKFGQSESKSQDITKAYVHANFVEKPLPNFVTQEQLKEAQLSMFDRIVALLINENLIQPIVEKDEAESKVVYINNKPKKEKEEEYIPDKRIPDTTLPVEE